MENTTIINQTGENSQIRATESVNFSKLFSLRDLKSDNFGSIFTCYTTEEAIRAVKIRLMYDQGSLIQQFPADYMLYHIGYFNTNSGVMESTGVPVPVKSVFDISLELEKERKERPVDVPEFMKGDNNVDRNQESVCEESTGDNQ